jgi:pimeloyl-ACP methyl ester carboxylesterase
MKWEQPMHSFEASDGLTLRYAVDDYTDPWKTSETLFLLHAAMGSSRRLYKWVPVLAGDFRLVRPDMRGHGASDVPGEEGLSPARLVQDVLELAGHLGCDRFHLAGSSAGAIISLQLALDHPQRVSTLGLFAASPGLKRTQIDPQVWIAKIRKNGMRGFLEETIDERFPPGTDPAFVRWFVDEASRTNPEFLGRFVPMMQTIDQSERLHEIRCPVLSVVPDSDPHITLSQYEVIRDRVPGCEFIVYHGLQHNITDGVPKRCANELKRFLLQHRNDRA